MLDADFTVAAYEGLLAALRGGGYSFALFREEGGQGQRLWLRHDVDRLPGRALAIGRAESSLGARSTFFFRTKPHVLREGIVRELAEQGHEIGYHYEDLVDARGDATLAWEGFRRNLARLRAIAPVSSIAMHGRPFSPIDGRDLWRTFDYRSEGIRCEAYLDIDWATTHYFTDTGRGWNAADNVRDRPAGGTLASPPCASTRELGRFLARSRAPAVVSSHPERWAGSWPAWVQVFAVDSGTNLIKRGLKIARRGASG